MKPSRAARIDIVGGESEFFDKIVDSVKGGKAVDRFVYNSEVATDVKNTFFNGNPEYFRDKLQQLVGQFDLSTDDIKDLSVAALIGKMLGLAGTEENSSQLRSLQQMAANIGLADEKASTLRLEANGGGGSQSS